MKQKSLPDLITPQCLEKHTQRGLKTDHTHLSTETGICFLNSIFYVLPVSPPPSLPQLGYQTYHQLLSGKAYCYCSCFALHKATISRPPSSLLLKMTCPLLPDFTFLNHTELILRYQNAGIHRYESILLYYGKKKKPSFHLLPCSPTARCNYALHLSSGLIELNLS